jgi:predicted NAD/FAD-dependent oxidoreductase
MLDAITTSLLAEPNRRTDEFKVLRQALAYGWSVAVAALPAAGKPLLEKWLTTEDRDLAWMARENLKKDRLKRMDAAWVAHWSGRAP